MLCRYLSPDTCPEAHLLYFHNVPYSRPLATHSNCTVLQYIYLSHQAGAAAAADFVRSWTELADLLGNHTEYTLVLSRLQTGAADAAIFAKAVIDYFAVLTGIPPPPFAAVP